MGSSGTPQFAPVAPTTPDSAGAAKTTTTTSREEVPEETVPVEAAAVDPLVEETDAEILDVTNVEDFATVDPNAPDFSNRLRPQTPPDPVTAIVSAPGLEQSRMKAFDYPHEYGRWLDDNFARYKMGVVYGEGVQLGFRNHVGVLTPPECTVDGVNTCLLPGEEPYRSLIVARPRNLVTGRWQGPVAGQNSDNEYLLGSVGIDFATVRGTDDKPWYITATIDFSDNLPLYDMVGNLDTSKEPFVVHGCEVGTGCYQTLDATFYKPNRDDPVIIGGRVSGADFEGLYIVRDTPQ